MKTFTSYINEQREALLAEGLEESYRKLFDKLLAKYNAKSPADIKDEAKKKAFFDELADCWTAKAGLSKAGEKVMKGE